MIMIILARDGEMKMIIFICNSLRFYCVLNTVNDVGYSRILWNDATIN